MNDLIIEKLSFRTKTKYINEVINGTKKVETRLLSKFYADRLLHFTNKKLLQWDEVKQVNVIHLYTGNKPGCKFVDVRVLKTILVEYIKDIPEGLQKGDMAFEFELGDIIEHN